MEIDIYFNPLSKEKFGAEDGYKNNTYGQLFHKYIEETPFPDISEVDIVVLGIEEDRLAVDNKGCGDAPDYIREYLYKLFQGPYKTNIADLGNIKRGHEIKDTYFAVSQVVSYLLSQDIIPVIIGGSQDLMYANYRAYENNGQIINIAQVDASFDLGALNKTIDSQSYLNKIITHQPNYLFNFTNIGYQTYFIDQPAIDLMRNLFFDTYRLGVVQNGMEEVEPIVRNADMFSFDVSAIRKSDAPGNGNATPNGFYGEEACRIARYAGISDKLSSIGFYEMNPLHDKEGQTAHLVAQMIWYFLDGYYSRKGDYPYKSKENYVKYHVANEEIKQEITFYKSKKSDRWWMEVPCSVDMRMKYERHNLVPCSFEDYEKATNNAIPDRWWQVFQKMM